MTSDSESPEIIFINKKLKKKLKKKRKKEHEKLKEEKVCKKLKHEEQQNMPVTVSENAKAVCDYTVSIAVPGSIMDNAQSPELKTYLAGQIARAAAVFCVNEIVVFDDTCRPNVIDDEQPLKLHQKMQGCSQLMKILQYLECPQYLRKYYFPIHKDLEYAGLLNPLDIPHHLRVDEESEYREGVVMNKPVKEGKGSYVYIGLPKIAVIDKILETNIRVTVKLDEQQKSKKHLKGKAVSPSIPLRSGGIYWGYNVRFARSLNAVFTECPFKGGYDVTIGTSDKGNSVDLFQMPKFKRLLIVFGGLRGLEVCLEDDESISVSDPKDLFNFYLNTCPLQGSRTIRTEEAVLITLAALRSGINQMRC